MTPIFILPTFTEKILIMKKILKFIENYGVYSLLLLSLCEFAFLTPIGYGFGCFFLFSYLYQIKDKQNNLKN